MSRSRLLVALLAALLLGACAEEPAQPRMTYGPPNPHLAPADMQGFRGMSGWTTSGESYHPSTPSSFKGF